MFGRALCRVSDGLFDTTFFIDLRKGDAGAMQLWSDVEAGRFTAAFCTVTVFELWVGSNFTSEDGEFYSRLFSQLNEVPLSAFAAAQAGIWLRGLSRLRRERRSRDAMIAATAWERSEPVYTRNIDDFLRYHARVETY
jgi:predicted nucleic acid-binding protein